MTDLQGAVVVITGASSGLGRATAIEFARQGSTVILAARRGDALDEVAARCAEAGGRGHVVVADVTREADMTRVAEEALAQGGRIDVWINNAGVTLFGRIEDGPFEEHRRVIETNVLGYMLGARAVVPIFRRQHRGVLINVGSILGKVGQPYVPSYVVSKFAIRGLTEALRSDLSEERDVHVCTLLPFSIDTPHFESGANHIGHPARAIAPMQPPEKIARALVALARNPVREKHVPGYLRLGLFLHAAAPRIVERMIYRTLTAWHFGPGSEPTGAGNLYLPPATRGESRGHRPPRIGGLRFVAWLLRELVNLQLDSARRVARRALGQGRREVHAAP